MAEPTDLAWAAPKRLARYLKAMPRMVCSMRFQNSEAIGVYSDTDWAGCLRTHKSTSGACVMLGSHMTKAWSPNQASLVLSSGEAEYYDFVRATGIGLGLQDLLGDVGVCLHLMVWTDNDQRWAPLDVNGWAS